MKVSCCYPHAFLVIGNDNVILTIEKFPLEIEESTAEYVQLEKQAMLPSSVKQNFY